MYPQEILTVITILFGKTSMTQKQVIKKVNLVLLEEISGHQSSDLAG